MWIMTNFGAFMPALRPAKTIAAGDSQTIQVRARVREHLERLREHYMPDLGPTYEIPHSDYEYRANCTPGALAAAMVKITLDIDYIKFKPTVTDQWGDRDLEHAYVRIWSAINAALGAPAGTTEFPHTYQPRPRGSWSAKSGSGSAKSGALVDTTDWPSDWDDFGWHSAQQPDLFGEPIDYTTSSEPFKVTVRTPFCKVNLDGECENTNHLHDGPVAASVLGGPVKLASGRLDHADCDHAPTKNARSRCRRRYARGGN